MSEDAFISSQRVIGRPTTSEAAGYGGFLAPPPRPTNPPKALPSEGLGVVPAPSTIGGAIVGTGLGSSSQLSLKVPRTASTRHPAKLPSVDPLSVSAALTKSGILPPAPRSKSIPRGVPDTLVSFCFLGCFFERCLIVFYVCILLQPAALSASLLCFSSHPPNTHNNTPE